MEWCTFVELSQEGTDKLKESSSRTSSVTFALNLDRVDSMEDLGRQNNTASGRSCNMILVVIALSNKLFRLTRAPILCFNLSATVNLRANMTSIKNITTSRRVPMVGLQSLSISHHRAPSCASGDFHR